MLTTAEARILCSAALRPSKEDMEKQAFFVTIPLLVKLAFGLMTAHGIYSGAKKLVKGEYASGAFDLAMSLPFIGFVGKGLRAGGVLARIAARGGRVGNLGKRFANMAGKLTKAQRSIYTPTYQAAFREGIDDAVNVARKAGNKAVTARTLPKEQLTEIYNAARNKATAAVQEYSAAAAAPPTGWFGSATKAVGDTLAPVKNTLGKAYTTAGWMPASSPTFSGVPGLLRPAADATAKFGKGVSRFGRSLEGVGNIIENTRVGRYMGSLPVMLGLSFGGPMLYEKITGRPLDPAPTSYAGPAAAAANTLGRTPGPQGSSVISGLQGQLPRRNYTQGYPTGFSLNKNEYGGY